MKGAVKTLHQSSELSFKGNKISLKPSFFERVLGSESWTSWKKQTFLLHLSSHMLCRKMEVTLPVVNSTEWQAAPPCATITEANRRWEVTSTEADGERPKVCSIIHLICCSLFPDWRHLLQSSDQGAWWGGGAGGAHQVIVHLNNICIFRGIWFSLTTAQQGFTSWPGRSLMPWWTSSWRRMKRGQCGVPGAEQPRNDIICHLKDAVKDTYNVVVITWTIQHLATFEIYLDVLISSQFFQQISLKVVFFLLGAFQALGRCILFHILCLLLLPQLFFGLLRENVIASWLLRLSTLDNLPPKGLFLHFSRIALGLCCQHQVVTFFWASRLSLLADVLRRRLLHRNGTYVPPLVVHQPRQHGLVGGWKRSLAGRFSINPDDSKG